MSKAKASLPRPIGTRSSNRQNSGAESAPGEAGTQNLPAAPSTQKRKAPSTSKPVSARESTASQKSVSAKKGQGQPGLSSLSAIEQAQFLALSQKLQAGKKVEKEKESQGRGSYLIHSLANSSIVVRERNKQLLELDSSDDDHLDARPSKKKRVLDEHEEAMVANLEPIPGFILFIF